MANNDQYIGLGMLIISIIGIIVELLLLLILPALNYSKRLGSFPAAQYWAITIPVTIGVVLVLGIVGWIGATMYKTPPPESWDFEEFEEEFDEDITGKTEESDDDFDIEDIDGVSTNIAESLREAGYNTRDSLANASLEDLTDIKGIGKKTAEKIIESANE